MGSFGNYMGATFGGELYSSSPDHWSNDQWQTLMGRDKPDRWLDARYHDQTNVAPLSNPSASTDNDAYKVDSTLLGDVPGLLSDDSTYQAVGNALHGGNALNWENWNFGELRDEKDALKPDKLRDLATAWTDHGNTLKTESENFKKTVRTAITGKWEGASAEAAEAASTHVTETSIYNFTPTSDALASRLTALKEAFDSIRARFPNHGSGEVIDKFEDANKHTLDQKVHEYNNKYHFDDSGHLRLGNGQYVDVQTAIDEAERIKQSIADYQQAVQLFRDTYTPAVQAVTQNFPNLPAPPDMTFKPAGPDPTGPGPTGPGGGPPGLGGKPDLKNTNGLKPFEPPKIPESKLTDPKLGQTKLPDIPTTVPTKPTGLDGLTDPVKSAIDAATGAAKDAIGQAADAAKNAGQGLQDPNLAGAQRPPEGVLGLGPQGLGAGGAGKGAGGGLGGGAMPRGLANGTAMGVPATAEAKVPAPATGAGLASGAGAPGAGAPAAGQRGDQNGKGHQVNKALRRKKNGKDVIGDAEAVVAVVGAPEEQGQPEESQVDQQEHRRRIPGRGNTWQPESAVQGGPRRSAAQDPGSATSDQLMNQ